MSKTSSSSDDAGKGAAAPKPEPGSREARLAEALRANLRRRKAVVKKTAEPTPEESGAADGDRTGEGAADRAEKSPDDDPDTP